MACVGEAFAPSAPEKGFYTSLAAGRTVHAYLVAGAEGSGKRAFAIEAARALLCENRRRDGSPCGACGPCTRAAAGVHPDLMIVSPVKAGIGVDEIRALLARLAITAYEGGNRVAIIENADKMTAQAQNALLKALEEPSPGIIFFLLATDSSQILPTVISRVRLMRMMPDADIAQRLMELGAGDDYAREISVLSGGALMRAKELYASPACLKGREKALSVLRLRGIADVPAAWQTLKDDKDIAQDILLWLECASADALRAQSGLGASIKIGGELSRFTFARLRSIMEEIVLVRKKLGSNVPWSVAVEPLLFMIAEGENE